jgi:hypothetical protein
MYNIIFQREQFSTARDEFCLKELAKTASLGLNQNHHCGSGIFKQSVGVITE